MDSLDCLETDLKTLCFQLPHWQQLLLQAFFYGILNWLISYHEEERQIVPNDFTLEDIVAHSDEEFRTWPSDWLQPWKDRILSMNLSLDDLYTLYEHVDTVFRDCIPVDLDIFSTLANGEPLTEDQWTRLYESVAFRPPAIQPTGFKKHHAKTRRMHGKRALTPLRRRRAVTHHKSHVNVVKLS
jgi:hypothetical protein